MQFCFKGLMRVTHVLYIFCSYVCWNAFRHTVRPFSYGPLTDIVAIAKLTCLTVSVSCRGGETFRSKCTATVRTKVPPLLFFISRSLVISSRRVCLSCPHGSFQTHILLGFHSVSVVRISALLYIITDVRASITSLEHMRASHWVFPEPVCDRTAYTPVCTLTLTVLRTILNRALVSLSLSTCACADVCVCCPLSSSSAEGTRTASVWIRGQAFTWSAVTFTRS